MSVIHNPSKPESALKKWCNAIAYHAIHESVAMGDTLIGHIRSDLLAKVVIGNKINILFIWHL